MFRAEAIDKQREALAGEVSIAIPISWQLVGYLIGGSILAAIAFLSLASYSRVETVSGVIAPAAGVSAIMPLRNGVITSLGVHEGQLVSKGALLASVRAEEDSETGVTGSARVSAAIARQDAELSAQSLATQEASQAQLRLFAAQRVGLAAELTQLEAQLEFQRGLVASAQRDLDRTKPVAERGFISARDLEQREETLLARKQALAQLAQAVSAKQAAIVEAERNATQIRAQSRAQAASLAAARAEVDQQAANVEGSRSYVLRAPIAGRVAALSARVGQPASAQVPLMTIVPERSELRAELAVPSAAIGFIKPGQAVRIAVDAFPYQRFGTIRGTILTAATGALKQVEPNGTVVSTYPVTVRLSRTAILAYGRNEPLVTGMSLTARIVTERQSFLSWLFDPLLAVERR